MRNPRPKPGLKGTYMEKRINVWLPEKTVQDINKRGVISEVTRESLVRYFALLDYERQQIRFTGGELSLLADICNGTAFTGGMIPLGLLADADDCENGYFEKWGVDRDELLAKLRSLTATQEYALVDAIERFWHAVSTSPSLDQPEPDKLLDC